VIALSRRPAAASLLALCALSSGPAPAQTLTLGDVLRTYGAAAGPIVACASSDELSKPIVLPDGFPKALSREDLACALRRNGCRVALLASGIAVLPSGEPGEDHPTWKQLDEIAAAEETLLALRAMTPEAAAVVLLGAWFRPAECPPAARHHLLAAMRLRVAPEGDTRLALRTAVRLSVGAVFRPIPTYLAPRQSEAYLPGRYQAVGLVALPAPGGLTCYVHDHEVALQAALRDSAPSWHPLELNAALPDADQASAGTEFLAAVWDGRRAEIDGRPSALGTLIAACAAPAAAPVMCDPALRDTRVLAVVGDGGPAAVLRAALVACQAEVRQEGDQFHIRPAAELAAQDRLAARLHPGARARFLAELLLPTLDLRGRAGLVAGTEFMREIIALGPPYAVPRERVPELLESGAPLDRMIGYFQQDPPDLGKWLRDSLTAGTFEARLVLSSTWASGHVVALVDDGVPAGDLTPATRYMVLEVTHASVGWDPQH